MPFRDNSAHFHALRLPPAASYDIFARLSPLRLVSYGAANPQASAWVALILITSL